MATPLVSLAVRYGTDKADHGYCEFYDGHFSAIRDSARAVLEIGVATGASLGLWLAYFPKAAVLGVDCDPAVLSAIPDDPRLFLAMADQSSREDWSGILGYYPGPYDLILDDGGHTMRQQQTSLAVLFPHVRPGGFYVCEDLHTSLCSVIEWRDSSGRLLSETDTGVSSAKQTTLALFHALERGVLPESDWIAEPERKYILDHTASCHVHDSTGDNTSITGLLVKK